MKRLFKRFILVGLSDKQPDYTPPLWFSIPFTLILFGGWFFLLVIAESIILKSLISIVAVVFFVWFFLHQYNQGYIHGAIYALKNPRTGETNFQITDGIGDDGEEIILWESETFTPNNSKPGPLLTSKKDYEPPTREPELILWTKLYPQIAIYKTKNQSWQNIKNHLERDFPEDKTPSISTIKKIYECGKAGKLPVIKLPG